MLPTLKVCSLVRQCYTSSTHLYGLSPTFRSMQHFGVGSIPWSPLGRGLLTRRIGEKTKRGEVDGCASLFVPPRNLLKAGTSSG
jgi:hypothetical protein